MDEDYTLNQCEGPLNYVFDEASGLFYLDNPIALMFAAGAGLPAVTKDEDDLLAIAESRDVLITTDGDPGAPIRPEYLDAAKKVYAALRGNDAPRPKVASKLYIEEEHAGTYSIYEVGKTQPMFTGLSLSRARECAEKNGEINPLVLSRALLDRGEPE